MSSASRLPTKVHAALSGHGNNRPYPRFVLDGVLDEVEYKKLLESYPDHLVGNPAHDRFVNYSIRPNAQVSENLSPEWQDFIATIRSEEVVSRLVEACLAETSRRYPAWWRWLLYFRLRNVRNYEINLVFSANYAGRYLPPHTDNSYKVLALVLYFADLGYSGASEGTRFFRPKSPAALRQAVKRFNRLSDSRITRFTPLTFQPMTSCSIHDGSLETERDRSAEKWFYDNFENEFNVSFYPNRIAGFVKTQNSFHSVDMRTSSFEGPRRSLLINLNLKHSRAARAWQSFRTRILGLSS